MVETKINTLSDYINSTPSPFLYQNDFSIEQVPAFLRDVDFQDALKHWMDLKLGDYELRGRYRVTAVEASQLIPVHVNDLYIANSYMLNGLWNSTQFDYNPIENYRMEEKGKDTNSGTDSTTHNIGKTSTQQIAGERTDTAAYGSQSNSMTYGAQESSVTHEVSPESSDSYTAESRDKASDGSHTDNQSLGSHTDNLTTGQQTVTVRGDAATNTDSLKHGHVLDHELVRSGNVGITTSQQMIESERNLVRFNIYKVVADLIVSSICCLVTTDF